MLKKYHYFGAAALIMSLLSCGSPDTPPAPAALILDTLITGGLVYDGTDTPPRKTSIGIKNGRIAFIGDHGTMDIQAEHIIDATNYVVLPGFIDPHTHSLAELQSTSSNSNLNYLSQGVTTVFVGNDGDGSHQVDALANSLKSNGIGTNAAFLVGHGAVREAAMGGDNRPPSDAEMENMQSLVEQAMREGAYGLSSGLYYTPGNFAATEEVIELAKVAARYSGIYESHIRDESSYSIGLIAAVEETLEIGRQAALPVHIAHIKALGVDVWGKSDEVIQMINDARKSGQQVTADQYPWRASGTHLRNALVPRWALAGTFEQYQLRLRDEAQLPKIEKALAENLRRRGGPESLLIVTCPNPEFAGQTLAAISETLGLSPISAALHILRLGKSRVVSFNMNPEDISDFMQQPWAMTSSDGTDGHPRKYASFPKKYRDSVVEQKLLSMQAFVHRSSGLTADTFGVKNRGYLRSGYFADITVLDPNEFGPQADYLHWNSLSTGVKYLLVNGVPAIVEGDYNGALAGRPLRKNQP
jgi:N-acyl-D-amino-acid deacylase